MIDLYCRGACTDRTARRIFESTELCTRGAMIVVMPRLEWKSLWRCMRASSSIGTGTWLFELVVRDDPGFNLTFQP